MNHLQHFHGLLTAVVFSLLQMVRQEAAHAIAALGHALGPMPVLSALGGALVHPNGRVREEGVNAYTASLLSHTKDQFDYPACVRALAGAASDGTPRVAAAALEAFAVLHSRLGALLQGLLAAVGVPDAVKTAVVERVRQAPALGMPGLDAEGNLQHQVRLTRGPWVIAAPPARPSRCFSHVTGVLRCCCWLAPASLLESPPGRCTKLGSLSLAPCCSHMPAHPAPSGQSPRQRWQPGPSSWFMQ